MLCILRKSIHS